MSAGVKRSYRQVRRALLAPRHLYSWSEIQSDPSVLPQQGGIYGWYFDRGLIGVPKRGCHGISRRKLLYVGISPSGPRSKGTVYSRVSYHFSGNAGGSTLRTTLASLLQAQLRARLRRVGRSEYIRLTSDGERRLTDWMDRHARVCWTVCAKPWEVEPMVIRAIRLPLNLAHNPDNDFRDDLMRVRKKARDAAISLPVLHPR